MRELSDQEIIDLYMDNQYRYPLAYIAYISDTLNINLTFYQKWYILENLREDRFSEYEFDYAISCLHDEINIDKLTKNIVINALKNQLLKTKNLNNIGYYFKLINKIDINIWKYCSQYNYEYFLDGVLYNKGLINTTVQLELSQIMKNFLENIILKLKTLDNSIIENRISKNIIEGIWRKILEILYLCNSDNFINEIERFKNYFPKSYALKKYEFKK